MSAALMAQGAGPVAASALETCAAIASPASRLACYDQLAGRPATAAVRRRSTRLHAATAAAAAVAGLRLRLRRRPSNPLDSMPPSTPLRRAGSVADRAKVARGPAERKRSRHDWSLEGGQVWELEEPDALLASGDAITIRRAALGSFLMNTAQGRTHRVHRLH